MNTAIWGPLMWSFLNDVATVGDIVHDSLDESSRKLFLQFLTLMKFILPCKYCRESYTQYSGEMPPSFPLKPWLYTIHNKVNKKLDKQFPIEEDIFKRRSIVYSSFGDTNKLWDILFILAMNHDKPDKIEPYRLFFRHLKWLYPTLIKYRRYDPSLSDLLLSYESKHIQSRLAMLKWLSEYNPWNATYKDLVLRYGEAIAYKTRQELYDVCGPLLVGKEAASVKTH